MSELTHSGSGDPAPAAPAATAAAPAAAASLSTQANATGATGAAASSVATGASLTSSPFVPPHVVFRGETWYSLCVPPAELRLDITLRNGQAFGWQRIDDEAMREASDKAANKGKGKAKRARNEGPSVPGEQAAAAAAAVPASAAAASIAATAPAAEPNVDVKLELPAVKLEVAAADPASATSSSSSSSIPLSADQLISLPPAVEEALVKSEPMDEGASASAVAGVSSAAAPAPAAATAVTPVLPSDSDPLYVGVMGHSLIGIRQTDSDIYYREMWSATPTPPAQLDAFMRDYMHLPSPSSIDPRTGAPLHADMLLSALYPVWSANATRRFQFVASVFPGVRLLRQEPTECLFSFICSSNNHISRIGGMLASLRSKYGERLPVPVAEVLGPQHAHRAFHAFPTVEALCGATEAELRALGFGYRAKYIVSSAALLRERGGAPYLLNLRTRPRAEVEQSLESFAGVGPKVASCIALFSLDQLDAIPVDTHVWQIAVRDYARAAEGLDLSTVKSLTKRVYQAVGDIFRTLFGAYAGWAHCLLFLAELPEFKRTLVARGILDLEAEEEAPPADAATTDPAAPLKEEARDADADVTEDEEEGEGAAPQQSAAAARKQKRNQNKALNSKTTKITVPELSHAFPQRKRSKPTPK